MKRMTYFVMALALVLGLTQCKKDQIEPQGGQVRITLDVENGGKATDGTRVNVNDNHVTFEEGDKILVGYNGAYVGTLTHNGTRFEGSINATQVGDQRLYFYFVGNKQETLAVGDESCTVNISDQTKELPVLSFSESTEDFTGEGSYTASLHNQCALVKFTLDYPAGSILVGNMHTKVTISFSNPSITPIEETTGSVRLYSKTETDTEKWAILLPQSAVDDAPVIIGSQDLTVDVPEITAGAYVTSISAIDNDASSIVNLAGLSTDLYTEYIVMNGDILTGTLDGVNDETKRVKITIADGAAITLRNAQILGYNNDGNTDYLWAGLTCLGDATIILEGTNTVKGFNSTYPGVQAGPAGTTLTIEGSGTLNATGGSKGAAGIGSGKSTSCGNITINGGNIEAWGGANGAGIGTGYCNVSGSISCGIITITGGTVTAYGGENAAGIGAGQSKSNKSNVNNCNGINISGGIVTAIGGGNAAGIGSGYAYGTKSPISSCGDINITGGTVVATGGSNSAGIGTGNTYVGNSNCGNITITPGVTSVTATKGTSARDSIGRGKGNGTCGTVMFGGATMYDGLWIAPESGSTYGGLSFSITTVTNTDDTWVLQPE